MSDTDRGAYTPPTDAPLSFDARQPVRGARPVPMTLIVSALVLLVLIVAIFMFYRGGVREAGQAPQTVGTPVGEMKSAAPPEVQAQDPAAGLQIYQSESGEAAQGQPQFTAPPEQPAPRVAAAPPPPVAAPTTPIGAAPAQLPPTAPAAPAPKTVAQAPTPAPKAAPVATPASKAVEVAAPAAGGAASVQIGAFSSQALAEKGLADAAGIAGAGKGRSIQPIQRNGATLYRTTVTGFASRAEAQAYCGKLQAAGKSCFVK
jgi:outer membrane biosynthesis protein TonB